MSSRRVGQINHENDRDRRGELLRKKECRELFEHDLNGRTQEASSAAICRNSRGISTREAVDDGSGPQRKKGNPVQGA